MRRRARPFSARGSRAGGRTVRRPPRAAAFRPRRPDSPRRTGWTQCCFGAAAFRREATAAPPQTPPAGRWGLRLFPRACRRWRQCGRSLPGCFQARSQGPDTLRAGREALKTHPSARRSARSPQAPVRSLQGLYRRSRDLRLAVSVPERFFPVRRQAAFRPPPAFPKAGPR